VQVFADPSVVLGHLDATVTTAVCTRTTDADAGLCIVEVPVESAWFVATATEDSDRTLSISAIFVDAVDDVGQLGDVVVKTRQNMVAHLPAYPVWPGSSFEVPVYGAFEHLFETFTVDFEVGLDSVLLASRQDRLRSGLAPLPTLAKSQPLRTFGMVLSCLKTLGKTKRFC
jgi:hypothetical protein